MSFNKKLLASAIAGLLFSANAGAVVLGTDPARIYAEELVAPVDLSADAADTASFAIGYNFSDGEVRYGRFECTDNMTMDNVTVSTASADVTLGAINGEGTSALFFSMTAGAAPGVTADDVINVDGDNTLEDDGAVSCAFSIYDQPSQAQAGGATGRIYTTGFQPFIQRAPSFVFVGTPAQAVADVEAADGAYFHFVGGNDVIGALQFSLAPVVPMDADGTPITLADIFNAATSVVVDGDFSAAGDAIWVGYGSADDLDDDAATFDVGSTANTGNIRYVENGTDAIPEGEFTATLDVVTNPGYAAADVTVDVGAIVRNGTQLQAPLAQVPGAGWLSRMVLTNTGNVARPYEISVMGEDGNVIGTANTTGTVPANGTVVVDLTQVMTSFTAGMQRRGTLNVTVAAPNNQIQGLYQIVNANAGSLSNHVMVRPGTN